MRYIIYFDNGIAIWVNAGSFTEAAIKATQKDPKEKVVRITRVKDNRTVETHW